MKPANILLTDAGDAKLGDFGIAKLVDATRLTQTGKSLGTPAYKSPEQSRGDPVDHRSDIWSLGVVLYEMISERKPFRGEYEHAIVRSILEEEPEPLKSPGGRRGVPEALDGIVRKALAKNPAERYPTADEVASALGALSEEGSERTGDRPARKPRSRRRWLAAALLVVALGSVWAAVRLQPAPDENASNSTAVEIERFLNESRRLEIDGSLEEAEALYQKALEMDPESSPVLAHLALLRMRRAGEQEWDEVRALVDRALEDPSQAQAWVAGAKLLLREGRLKEAEEAARRAIEQTSEDDPDADRAHTALGEVLIALGRTEEGLETIRQAEERGEEGYIRAKLVKAYYLRSLGRQNEAAAEYEDVLRYREHHGPSLNNLGVFYLEMGRFDDAVPKLLQAFEMKPTARRANNLGTAYFYRGDWVAAMERFETAVELDPEYANGYGGIGDSLEEMGREQEAVPFWEKAVEKYAAQLEENDRLERRAQMAVYLAKLRRYEEALTEIDRALQEEPDHIEINFSAAQVFETVSSNPFGEPPARLTTNCSFRGKNTGRKENFSRFARSWRGLATANSPDLAPG